MHATLIVGTYKSILAAGETILRKKKKLWKHSLPGHHSSTVTLAITAALDQKYQFCSNKTKSLIGVPKPLWEGKLLFHKDRDKEKKILEDIRCNRISIR